MAQEKSAIIYMKSDQDLHTRGDKGYMERCGFLTKFLGRFTNTRGVWFVVSNNSNNNIPDFTIKS